MNIYPTSNQIKFDINSIHNGVECKTYACPFKKNIYLDPWNSGSGVPHPPSNKLSLSGRTISKVNVITLIEIEHAYYDVEV